MVRGPKARKDQIAILSDAGFQQRQIAAILGTTSNTVSVALTSIRKQITIRKTKNLVSIDKAALRMINKQIMNLLQDRTRVTVQRLYQMIEDKKQQYSYSISKETAAYLVAAENGIDISKYLKDDELSKVRELKAVIVPPVRPRLSAKEALSDSKQVVIEIDKGVKIVDPLLPKKFVTDATKMAGVYPVVYIFENSVRNLISNVMNSKYEDKWWDARVGPKIREKVKGRIDNEDKNRWHGRRGAHPIFYTDIDELKSIITTNWSNFEDIFPNLQWVTGKIDEIEMSRNIIAHNNPLEDRDIVRLKLNLEDWLKQIASWTEKSIV
ncbi:MAG: DUF2240 family protein [Candidatus Bathyarchaeia archaeon]|jgi:DNA-binding CsgD family transcriptional regulator